MKKKTLLYIIAATFTCACSSSQPEECVIPKNTVELAGNAFSSFSLGADVKLHAVQNPENGSQWTIQAVAPVRKEVSTPIEELSLEVVPLDDSGVRLRDDLVLQAEDLANLLPVYNASENVERVVVFSIPEKEKKYLSNSEVAQLLANTKKLRMNINATLQPEPSAAKVAETPAVTVKTEAKKETTAPVATTTSAPKEYPMTLDGLCRKHGVYGLLSQYEQALKNRNKSGAKKIEDQLWVIEKRIRADKSIPERLRSSFVRYVEDKEDEIEDRY